MQNIELNDAKAVHVLKKEISLASLMHTLQLPISGDLGGAQIRGVSQLSSSGPGILCFSKKPIGQDYPKGAIIIAPDGKNVILSENPRLDFIRSLIFLCELPGFVTPSDLPKVHSSAIIADTTHVANGVEIGENTTVEWGVVLHPGTTIGRNCHIGANTVIGAEGFGYERTNSGQIIKFPHLGGVIIEDGVEIGSNSNIDRGTLNNTIIEHGVKVDNLVQIAHNCVVGQNTMIASNSGIGGSVKIGQRCWIGTGANIKNGITIGDDVFVGIGSVVVRNVKTGLRVFGVPASKILHQR